MEKVLHTKDHNTYHDKPNPENPPDNHTRGLLFQQLRTRHTSRRQTLCPATDRRHHHPGCIFGCAKKQPTPDIRHAVGQTRMVAPIKIRAGPRPGTAASAATRQVAQNCSGPRPREIHCPSTPGHGGCSLAGSFTATSRILRYHPLRAFGSQHTKATDPATPFSASSKGPRPALSRFIKRIFGCGRCRSPAQFSHRNPKTCPQTRRKKQCQH